MLSFFAVLVIAAGLSGAGCLGTSGTLSSEHGTDSGHPEEHHPGLASDAEPHVEDAEGGGPVPADAGSAGETGEPRDDSGPGQADDLGAPADQGQIADEGGPPPCPDGDGDGHTAFYCGGDDCDDARAEVHAGQPEICGNGLDDDCAGGDAPCPPCLGAPPDPCSGDQQLPIPTHFSAATLGFAYLAADQLDVLVQQPASFDPYLPGTCYPIYNHGFIPGYDQYVGEDFSVRTVTDDEARQFAADVYSASGVALRHLWPPTPEGNPSGRGGPDDGLPVVQAIHGVIADGSLYTIFLPPGWRAAAGPGSYPIVMNGFYDLNENTFTVHGRFLAGLVARSGLGGRRGVIGVLWNGGGALVSRTADERAFHQFAAVIDQIAARYGGSRQWIVLFGVSRGGGTTVGMSSNPYGHDYRVVLGAAVVPPTRYGEHTQLTGPTYPALIDATGWGVGLADAWLTGWTYPACGRAELVGLTAPQAHLQILTGSADPAFVDANLAPASPRFLDALSRAGTQIHLEIGEHDYIVPFALQLQYAKALWDRGLPVRIQVQVRRGHGGVLTGGAGAYVSEMERVVSAAAEQLSDPVLDLAGPVPAFLERGVDFYQVDRASLTLQPFAPVNGQFPFSVDLPRTAAVGEHLPLVFVGEPGTAFRLYVIPDGQAAAIVEGTIPDSYATTVWIDVQQAGHFGCRAEILKPGSPDWLPIASTQTPTGGECVVDVVAAEPPISTGAAAAAVLPAGDHLPAPFHEANWGLSEY